MNSSGISRLVPPTRDVSVRQNGGRFSLAGMDEVRKLSFSPMIWSQRQGIQWQSLNEWNLKPFQLQMVTKLTKNGRLHTDLSYLFPSLQLRRAQSFHSRNWSRKKRWVDKSRWNLLTSIEYVFSTDDQHFKAIRGLVFETSEEIPMYPSSTAATVSPLTFQAPSVKCTREMVEPQSDNAPNLHRKWLDERLRHVEPFPCRGYRMDTFSKKLQIVPQAFKTCGIWR